jgi:hypothetical protein
VDQSDSPEHTLEFLLDFDGRVHTYEQGYWLKFEITKTDPTDRRPHGLSYSFTLHGPNNDRLIGFDNAHGVPPIGSKFNAQQVEYDHWHRTVGDVGIPYIFVSAEKLLDDFFDAVERMLTEIGVPLDIVDAKEGSRP